MLAARKVLVVGGGIGGLTLANGLERVGIDYRVLEQAPSFSDVGFGITLGLNAMRTLELINPELERRVAAAGVPDTTYALVEPNGNVIFTPPASNKPGRNRYGLGQFLPIKRTKLQQELLKDIPKEKIVNSVVAKEFRQDDKGVTLVTEDGKEFTGDLIVGADGIHSKIREQLHLQYGDELGPAPPLRYSNYSLWGGQVQDGVVPPMDGRKCFYWSLMPDKKLFIALPMCNNMQYWSYGEVRDQPIIGSPDGRLPSADLKAQLLKDTEGLPSWQSELVRRTDSFAAWDLFDLPRDGGTKRWGHGKVTLMGDAAHAVTPWVGQGGSMSMEDAADLAYRLANTEDWNEAVAKFEERRIPRSQMIRKAANMNFDSFTASSPLRLFIRKALFATMKSATINDAFTNYLTKVDFPPEPLKPISRKL